MAAQDQDRAGVGIRELKAKLSENLARVKAGASVIVTERGRPIARITPILGEEVPPHLKALLESGAARWSGQRPLPVDPMPQRTNAGGKTAAQMISEDREDRF